MACAGCERKSNLSNYVQVGPRLGVGGMGDGILAPGSLEELVQDHAMLLLLGGAALAYYLSTRQRGRR